MKSYFAYIRVSTAKQGEQGSSLHEQRDAITAFAARQGFAISAWFEERETAAKIGRTEFARMLAALKKGKASGVIFHKIDRSARNLKDWSTIQDLAEQGVDVRFTQESINLGSNEGKLTGDFLAVISSHYIRNLREEVKKGIRGRLKQGFYPLPAPLGYLDQGSAKPKIPDPSRAPLVRDAFELYASGRFALRGLTDELCQRGLRGRSGKKVTVNGVSVMLRNPFYMGIIRMRRSGEVFAGVHQPIVPPKLFGRVQAILDGKLNAKLITHDFLFRRMIACAHCRYHLIAERQKGHVYYRCHTRKCPTCTVREEAVETAIRASLAPLSFLDDEMDEMRDMAAGLQTDWGTRREDLGRAIKLKIDNVTGRLSRLMDAYVDGAVERSLFDEKKLNLLAERRELEDSQARLARGQDDVVRHLLDFLEHMAALPLSYKSGNIDEKRDFVKSITSNLIADRKTVAVELRSPFREVGELALVTSGDPVCNRPRTFVKQTFDLLVKHFIAQAEGRQR
jgi:site-specific DNA recombinase